MSAATLTGTFTFEASKFRAATVAARRVGFIFANPKFDSDDPRQKPPKRKPFRKPKWWK